MVFCYAMNGPTNACDSGGLFLVSYEDFGVCMTGACADECDGAWMSCLGLLNMQRRSSFYMLWYVYRCIHELQ